MKKLTPLLLILVNILSNVLGIIRSKLLAIWHGIIGIGLLGQIVSFINVQSVTSTFGTKLALINLLTEASEQEKSKIISTGAVLLLCINIIIVGLTFLFINQLVLLIFKSPEYKNLLIIMIMIGPLLGFRGYIETILQAEKNYRIIIKSKSYAIVIAIILIAPLIYFFGIQGVVYDFILWFCLEFLLMLYFWLDFSKPLNLRMSWDKHIVKNIIKISGLNTIRYIAITIALLLSRILIVQLLTLTDAGYFQAIWSITSYINVIFTGLTFYFLPEFASVLEPINLREEINRSFNYMMYIVVPIFLAIFIIPKIILILLFSNTFEQLSNLLILFAVAKLFELVYIFYIVVFEAKAAMKIYFPLEIIKSILMPTLLYVMIKGLGFAGATYSFVLLHFCLAISVLFISGNRRLLLSKNNFVIISGLIVTGLIMFVTESVWLRVIIGVASFLYLVGFKNYIIVLRDIRIKLIGNQ